MVKVPTPIVELVSEEAKSQEVKLKMKRDDLIHPTIMGNKWRKLKYNLQEAKKLKYKTLLTFGGAFSNHIAATAAAAKAFGFKSVGIIRGDELNENSNPTLIEASKNGMTFRFVNRELFRNLKVDFHAIKKEYPEAYILPEGGTNALAIEGASEVIGEINEPYDYLICPLGTGGTMAGLLKDLPIEKKLIGISSLKGSFIHNEFRTLTQKYDIDKRNYEILDSYHFGGYGKVSDVLIDFINDFKSRHGVALDPIYTGKMMFGVIDLVREGFFAPNAKIMVLHTGGLQGIAGFNTKRSKMIL
ncbi:MAG: pyridoxal-phosphate dependent enzyme [Cyclobacteriaceae bacterium]